MKRLDILWSGLFGVMLWQIIVWITDAPHFILPAPLRVLSAAYDSRALIGEHAIVTAIEVIIGLAIGVVLGVLTGIGLAVSPTARRLFLPLLVFTQAVPVFALAPILTLWLGYGIGGKIVMTVLIIYFPITSSFYDGLTRVDGNLLDLAQTMGATKTQIMRRIRIPSALPSLGSGLRLAAVYAPIGAVIGEWVGSSKGLGYLMLLANGRVKTDLMFASLIVLAIFAVSLHVLVGKIADRLDEYSKVRTY